MKSNILQIAATKAAQLIAIFILSTSVSMAAAVYTYIGNYYNSLRVDQLNTDNIYDTSMRMELSFTTDTLLTNVDGNVTSLVTSFSIFDGIYVITEDNADLNISINSDNSGNILQWSLFALPPLPTNVGDTRTSIMSSYIINGSDIDNTITSICVSETFGSCVFHNFEANTVFNHGTWSVSAVPIPPALYLFGSGLLGLVGMARRKKA